MFGDKCVRQWHSNWLNSAINPILTFRKHLPNKGCHKRTKATNFIMKRTASISRISSQVLNPSHVLSNIDLKPTSPLSSVPCQLRRTHTFLLSTINRMVNLDLVLITHLVLHTKDIHITENYNAAHQIVRYIVLCFFFISSEDLLVQ